MALQVTAGTWYLLAADNLVELDSSGRDIAGQRSSLWTRRNPGCYPGFMRLPRLFLRVAVCLALLSVASRSCPVDRFSSPNGKSTLEFGSGRAYVYGAQHYDLPDVIDHRWAGIADDGQWVIVAGHFELTRFHHGKPLERAPLPMKLIDRVAGGWIAPGGSCYLVTDACDLWHWSSGNTLRVLLDAELELVLNKPDVQPDVAAEVAIQHGIPLRGDMLDTWARSNALQDPAYGHIHQDISACLKAYCAWRSGSRSAELRRLLSTVRRELPGRLVSAAEWRHWNDCLTRPSSETIPALERLVQYGRVSALTPALVQTVDAATLKDAQHGVPLPTMLGLGCARDPETLLDHLNWQSQYDSSYLELFTAIDCPEAVPGLVRNLSNPRWTSVIRRALWRQLRVDVGPDPRDWEAWLNEPHHDPAERGRVLLKAGDPAGLLWLGRADSHELPVQPRLVSRVGAPRLEGDPWLKGSRVGYIPRSFRGLPVIQRDWCWSLQDGSSLAPLPERCVFMGGDPRTGRFVVSRWKGPRDLEHLFRWGPRKGGTYGFESVKDRDPDPPFGFQEDEVWAAGHRVYRSTSGHLQCLEKDTGREIASIALNSYHVRMQPGDAPHFLAADCGREVLLLDPLTLRQVHTLRFTDSVEGVGFDENGRRLAVLSGDEISVYELEPSLRWSPSLGDLSSELWAGCRLSGGAAIPLHPEEYWRRVARWQAETGGSWLDGCQPPPPPSFPWQNAAAVAAIVLLSVPLLVRKPRRRSLFGDP